MVTSFVRVEGLAERVKKAERKDELWLYRFKRRLSMSRTKMNRLRNRYARFLCHRLSKYGPGESNPHGYDNFRRLQIAIRNHNQMEKE